MATEKQPPKHQQEPSDDDADRLIYEAFFEKGAFVPQTPEEVARAEATSTRRAWSCRTAYVIRFRF